MNWKLIFNLSLFGLAMAIATVYWIPSNIEWVFWLPIFVYCAYVISKKGREKFFLNSLFVGIFNSVWITAAHIILFDTYMAHHDAERAMMADSPMPVRMMMLITGPLIGVLSGLILGLFTFIATKIGGNKTA